MKKMKFGKSSFSLMTHYSPRDVYWTRTNADKWGFRAMLMNPFSVKGYSIETKDLSFLAPNTQHAEMRDFRQMLILNFHCNLDFGTQHRENGKRINNEDKENGILSGTK